jgi:hypothetical protein
MQSGNHKPFDSYCETRPYLLLYHNSLLECGDQALSNLAVPKLPDSVKRSSLDSMKVFIKSVDNGSDKKRDSSAFLEGLIQVSTKQNNC